MSKDGQTDKQRGRLTDKQRQTIVFSTNTCISRIHKDIFNVYIINTLTAILFVCVCEVEVYVNTSDTWTNIRCLHMHKLSFFGTINPTPVPFDNKNTEQGLNNLRVLWKFPRYRFKRERENEWRVFLVDIVGVGWYLISCSFEYVNLYLFVYMLYLYTFVCVLLFFF